MQYADLHVHTFYSDSTLSPDEVIFYAKEAGLDAIAICDHDCIDGILPCKTAGQKAGIEVIPGIELTAEKADAEIHLLGYFIDWEDRPFQKKLKEIQKSRVDRIYKMVEKLDKINMGLDPEEVFRLAGKGSVGRLHLAQAMLRAGRIKRIQEAFDKYIGFAKPCYVPNIRFSPKDAISLVLGVGGVPVLAHPYTVNNDEYILEFIDYGLKGIEAYHTDHSSSMKSHYENLAKRYGLLVTGGSDCHGMGKGRILMGGIRVPYRIVEKLKEKADEIKNERR